VLNQALDIQIDLDEFLNDSPQAIEAYRGDFLQGFLVKDADGFMEWQRCQSDRYREALASRLNQKMNQHQQDHHMAEYYARKLIQADEFEEEAYRVLMKINADKGAFNKAIDIYNKLSRMLDKELGITAEAQTTDLYQRILEQRKKKKVVYPLKPGDFFYGRIMELRRLNQAFSDFASGHPSLSFVLTGEAGIGKTKLKDEFLKPLHLSGFCFLQTHCYQAEERYFLKPWNTVLSRLNDCIQEVQLRIPDLWKDIIAHVFPDFSSDPLPLGVSPVEKVDILKPKVIEDTIIGLIKKVAAIQPIVMVVEDLQWIDTMSLSLLSNLLLHLPAEKLFFLGTIRTGHTQELDHFISLMKRYKRIDQIEIERFTQQEMEEFITLALPNFNWGPGQKEHLFHETEGNTFFLVEYLNSLRGKGNVSPGSSPDIQDILKSRVMDISTECKKILNLASLFFDDVSMDILTRVMGKNQLQIIDVIEEAKRTNIIKEIAESQAIKYSFTHHKLREYIYHQLSMARRRALHQKVALMLESTLQGDKRDIILYPKLIYHFSNARDINSTLKYSIKNASLYLDFRHELFPEVKDGEVGNDQQQLLTRELANRTMAEIADLFAEVGDGSTASLKLKKRRIEFFHLKGRYLILEGEYDEGVALIGKVIDEALAIGEHLLALKGYVQLIFFGRQVHNLRVMEDNIAKAFPLARKHGFENNVAQMLRLKGLHQMMAGDYKQSEAYFKESIAIFSRLNKESDRYSLSIAAAYNYIGDIRRCNQQFADALTYYSRAIKIARQKNGFSSLAVFFTNAGQAAFEQGDFKQSADFFNQANSMYNKLDTLWGRSLAEGYLALLLVRKKQYAKALQGLKNAAYYAERLKSPYEIGIVFSIKAEIRALMEKNHALSARFKDYLNQSIRYYCQQGISFLDQVGDSFERQRLAQLKEAAC
jgi:tetratricopeptide (TPR) repeat protein